jgi:hypothetical protein
MHGVMQPHSRQSLQNFTGFALMSRRAVASPPQPPALPAGTISALLGFPRMRIREENCNMVLLAVVTCIGLTIAGGASLLGFGDTTPVRIADRTASRAEPAPSPDKRIIYVADQPQVRVIGAPFVPNTKPRER